jgi:hypothetical protein
MNILQIITYKPVLYAIAHNHVYGSDIDQAVILMTTPDCFFSKVYY